MTSRWPEKVRRYLRAVFAWDFYLALGLGGAFAAFALNWEGTVEAPVGVGIAAIPFGAGILAASWQQYRSAHDLMGKTEYGELVRIKDPDYVGVFHPYKIVIAAALVTMMLGLLGTLILNTLTPRQQVAFLSLLLASVAYDIFGLVSLIGITRWHDRSNARLLREKERSEVLERRLKKKDGT